MEKEKGMKNNGIIEERKKRRRKEDKLKKEGKKEFGEMSGMS